MSDENTQPDIAVTPFWSDKSSTLKTRIDGGEKLDDMLSWSEVQATMFVGEAPFIPFEREALRQAGGEWASIERLQELGGYPSTNLLHQAYHLLRWSQATGKRVADLRSIVEVGGGYGALARVVRHLGFKGRYTIYDLPEMRTLQAHYAKHFHFKAEFKAIPSNPTLKANLFVALWSLSEMDVADVEQVLHGATIDHCLIAYNQAGWHGQDNTGPLKVLAERGESVAMEHIPSNWYVFI